MPLKSMLDHRAGLHGAFFQLEVFCGGPCPAVHCKQDTSLLRAMTATTPKSRLSVKLSSLFCTSVLRAPTLCVSLPTMSSHAVLFQALFVRRETVDRPSQHSHLVAEQYLISKDPADPALRKPVSDAHGSEGGSFTQTHSNRGGASPLIKFV